MGIINQEFYFEIRRGKALVIFPDAPYWMIVSLPGLRLLQLCYEFSDLDSVVEVFTREFPGSAGIREKLDDLLRPLNQCGLLSSGIKTEVGLSREPRLTLVEICLTNECNLRCPVCLTDSGSKKPNELTSEEIKRILEEALPLLAEGASLNLVGGEPLLRFEVLAEVTTNAVELGYSNIHLETNATLVDRGTAKSLRELRFANVTLRLDGLTPDVHGLTRASGSFQAILQGIDNLLAEGLMVTVSSTVHTANFHQVPGLIRFCQEKGMRSFTAPLLPIGRCNLPEGVKPVPLSELVAVLLEVYKGESLSELRGTALGSLYEILNNLSKRKSCGIGYKSLYIDADGKVFPCLNSVVSPVLLCGDVRQQSVTDIWNESSMLRAMRRIDVERMDGCHRCEIRYFCGGHCRAGAFALSGKLNRPFPECEEIKQSIKSAMWALGGAPRVDHSQETVEDKA